MHGRWLLLTAATLFAACNPFDPPLYETPLPNGYRHESIGGEFGFLVDASGLMVEPAGMDQEHWCNNFAWNGDFVACEMIAYGERGFVDPPKSIAYLLLDTRSGTFTLFKTREELEGSWRRVAKSELPPLWKEHPSRRKRRG